MPAARRYLGSFPCSASGARLARGAIKHFAAQFLRESALEDLETAVGEAVANAVEHSDATTLTVRCSFTARRLIAEIEYDGRPFSPPTNVEPPPREAMRGFGLFIMHRLLTEVEFFNEGRGLRLVMRAPPR